MLSKSFFESPETRSEWPIYRCPPIGSRSGRGAEEVGEPVGDPQRRRHALCCGGSRHVVGEVAAAGKGGQRRAASTARSAANTAP